MAANSTHYSAAPHQTGGTSCGRKFKISCQRSCLCGGPEPGTLIPDWPRCIPKGLWFKEPFSGARSDIVGPGRRSAWHARLSRKMEARPRKTSGRDLGRIRRCLPLQRASESLGGPGSWIPYRADWPPVSSLCPRPPEYQPQDLRQWFERPGCRFPSPGMP